MSSDPPSKMAASAGCSFTAEEQPAAPHVDSKVFGATFDAEEIPRPDPSREDQDNSGGDFGGKDEDE